MKEIEIRVQIKNKEKIKNVLDTIGAKKKFNKNQKDSYFKHSNDINRKVILRIRKTDNETHLTFKGSSNNKEDIGWNEWENKITEAESLAQLLIHNGFEMFLEINKNRISYKYKEYEINLDEIEDLGSFMEIEKISEDVDKTKIELIQTLKTLFDINEKNIIKKGYVQLKLGE